MRCPFPGSKIQISFKSFVTLAALMWFLPNLCSQMFCKTIYICKYLITLATLKWVLPSVHSLVLYKINLFHRIDMVSSLYSITRFRYSVNLLFPDRKFGLLNDFLNDFLAISPVWGRLLNSFSYVSYVVITVAA